jgi:hypothetical protein
MVSTAVGGAEGQPTGGRLVLGKLLSNVTTASIRGALYTGQTEEREESRSAVRGAASWICWLFGQQRTIYCPPGKLAAGFGGSEAYRLQ